MHDLRFIGVDEPATHLLLGDDDGNRFQVLIDEPLRVAASVQAPASLRPRPVPVDSDAGLRPKDVQAMIRAGHPAEVVAERAGWTVEKVHRYEGPILGERAYVAGLARVVRLRPRGSAHTTAATLEARVAERLLSREIEPSAATWDSFRTPTGHWSVVVFFAAGGRERQACWEFDPLARTVSATDDEARWLSEDEDGESPGPLPAPHLQAPARPSRVYDVEAEGGLDAPQQRRRSEPVDLMSAMRERSSQRGRRRRSKASEAPGLDRVPDEALPLEDLAMTHDQAGEPPAAHPPVDPLEDLAPPDEGGVTTATERGREPRRPTAPVDEPLPLDVDEEPDGASAPDPAADNADSLQGASGVMGQATPPEESELGAAAMTPSDDVDDKRDPSRDKVGDPPESPHPQPTSEPTQEPESADALRASDPRTADEPPAPTRPTASRKKSGRPSVPSWDDIMFGKRPE